MGPTLRYLLPRLSGFRFSLIRDLMVLNSSRSDNFDFDQGGCDFRGDWGIKLIGKKINDVSRRRSDILELAQEIEPDPPGRSTSITARSMGSFSTCSQATVSVRRRGELGGTGVIFTGEDAGSLGMSL